MMIARTNHRTLLLLIGVSVAFLIVAISFMDAANLLSVSSYIAEFFEG